MNKIIYIFLDIDGVIATSKSFNDKWLSITGFDVGTKDFEELLKKNNTRFPPLSCENWPFDENCIHNIHTLQLKYRSLGYNVKYIISSTWRKGSTLKEIDQLFIMKGLVLDTIVGKTEVLMTRGEEIFKYINDNNLQDECYIIIDDESKTISELIDDDHIITTRYKDGFNKSNLIKTYHKIDKQNLKI